MLIPFLLLANLAAGADGNCTLRLSFGTGSAVISGRIGSDAAADILISAITQARPDLTVDRTALVIDPPTAIPELTAWPGLISELGLSTHEGLLELWPDHLVIGGLTDSQVTRSALFIRAEPILGGREIHDRICLVNSEDLPEIDVSVTRNTDRAPSASSAAAQDASFPPSSLDLAGLSLAKLLPTLGMLSRTTELSASSAPVPPQASTEPLRATPMESPLMPPGQALPAPLLAKPIIAAEPLPSILFSRNSFLLQANQVPVIDAVAKQLLAPAYGGAIVRIEAVKARGGSAAFNEYLCERRSAEVTKLLVERGLEEKRFSARTVDGISMVDAGEVRVLAELPVPPEPEPVGPPGTEGQEQPASSSAPQLPATTATPAP